MLRYIARRVVLALLVLVSATVFLFVLSRAAGDPRFLYMNETTNQEEWEAWGRKMGLDRPIVVQFWSWFTKALRGDFGSSLWFKRDSFEIVRERVPATLQLAGSAFAFTMIVAIPLGVLSAVRRGSPWDYVGRVFALMGQSMPGFWVGIVLIMLFAVQLELLPTGRRGDWSSYILPTITLGWFPAAGMLRLVRSSMLEILDSEFIKLARAKGVSQRGIIWKHAFRNALIAPLTYASLLMAGLVTGAVVTETVFAWPGLGRLGVQAVNNNDFPLMSAVVVLTAVVYIIANLFVDIAYVMIDPRIKLT
ncbi:MAG: ABC transporter permease [Chloroflexi bacterium]|nr:ABC transporter permease [Chloroflexota bacterium]